jgi:hypothetical protein
MGDSSQEDSAHGDEDHGLGDVEALLKVTNQAAPADHPAEAALDDPTARQDLEAGFGIGSADDLDDEVEKVGFVHELQPVVGAIGEQMLDPGPALADAIEDRLGASAVGDVGGVRLTISSRPSVSTAM